MTNAQYFMYSYFKRISQGSGTLYETPAVSAKPVWTDEYNTVHFDSNQSLSYSSQSTSLVSQAQEAGDNIGGKDTGEYFASTIRSGDLSIKISGVQGQPNVKVSVTNGSRTAKRLAGYVDWARKVPVVKLRNAGVNEVLTTVTFNQPISQDGLETLSIALTNAAITQFKAVYVDSNNADCNTNTWTIGGFVNDGENYLYLLDRFVSVTEALHVESGDNNRQIELNGIQEEPSPIELEPVGLVGLTAWLPLDEVEHLNDNKAVYLADSSPSYLRMLASNTDRVREFFGDESASQMKDGFESFIIVKTHDLYAESQTAAGRVACNAVIGD